MRSSPSWPGSGMAAARAWGQERAGEGEGPGDEFLCELPQLFALHPAAGTPQRGLCLVVVVVPKDGGGPDAPEDVSGHAPCKSKTGSECSPP